MVQTPAKLGIIYIIRKLVCHAKISRGGSAAPSVWAGDGPCPPASPRLLHKQDLEYEVGCLHLAVIHPTNKHLR